MRAGVTTARALAFAGLRLLKPCTAPRGIKQVSPASNVRRLAIDGERHHAFQTVNGLVVMRVRMGRGTLAPAGTVNSNMANWPLESLLSSRKRISICPTRMISFSCGMAFYF